MLEERGEEGAHIQLGDSRLQERLIMPQLLFSTTATRHHDEVDW